jgi:hypothetical protein
VFSGIIDLFGVTLLNSIAKQHRMTAYELVSNNTRQAEEALLHSPGDPIPKDRLVLLLLVAIEIVFFLCLLLYGLVLWLKKSCSAFFPKKKQDLRSTKEPPQLHLN